MTECSRYLLMCGEGCGGYEEFGAVDVRCASGVVRGQAVRTCYGPQFVRFAGVPYAKPPLGPLRFLPPVPIRRWDNLCDATKLKPNCMSYNGVTRTICGSEDCLHVTIHTPELEPNELLPVMVWLGGWGFAYDNHSYVGAGWLTNERIVVVYVSFRLGPFGFLSIGQATAPGNCGLKDVVVALDWIKHNIAAFGGNPDNVTVFGTTSGSSMVHYLMLSPLATGLYHKAIVQSGTALHNWALSYHPLDAAKTLAKELNVNTDDMHEAVEALRTMPAAEIMRAFGDLTYKQYWKTTSFKFEAFFKPCIENEFEGQQAFLTKYPYYLLKTGRFNRVPLMIGNNPQEGKILKIFEKSLNQKFQKINVDLSTLVPPELGLEDHSTGSKSLGMRLIHFYVPGDKLTEEHSEGFFNFMSDYYFTYYTNRCVKAHARHAADQSIYYYLFDAPSILRMPVEYSDWGEVGGEWMFLFQAFSCVYYDGGSEASRVRKKLLKLWTNFAKYGNPTPDKDDKLLQVTWDPVTDPDRIACLGIGQSFTKGCNPYHERMSFWDSVLDETNYTRVAAFFDNYLSL